MNLLKSARISLLAASFLGFAAFPPASEGANRFTALPGNATSIQWPNNNITLSQLQQLESQYGGNNQLNGGNSQLNIQFPNQLNWPVTPNSLQTLLSDAQQAAQTMGVSGQLPNFVFSSIAQNASSVDLGQMSIQDLMQGNVSGQIDNVMRQLRYQELNLSNMLPDWLKNIIVTVYDAVYSAFDYVQAQMADLLRKIM